MTEIAVTVDTHNASRRTDPAATLRIGPVREDNRGAPSVDAARDELAVILNNRKKRLLADLAHVQYNLDNLQELYPTPPRLADFLAAQRTELVAQLAEHLRTPGRFRVGPLQVDNAYMDVPGLWVLQLDEYAPVTECFNAEATALVRAMFEEAGLRISSEWNGENFLTWSIRATPAVKSTSEPGTPGSPEAPGAGQPDEAPAPAATTASEGSQPLPPPGFPVTMARLLEVLEWIPGMTTDKPVRSMALAAIDYARMLDPLSRQAQQAEAKRPSLAGFKTVQSDTDVLTMQLRYARRSLHVIADGIAHPGKYAVMAMKHIWGPHAGPAQEPGASVQPAHPA